MTLARPPAGQYRARRVRVDESREDPTLVGPGAVALRRLANLLTGYTPHDGVFPLPLPGANAVRLSRMTTEAAYATVGPTLCVAAQGAKAVMLGREVLE